MFTQEFTIEGTADARYAYQTIVTPDPFDGSPVCSLLLLQLQDGVAVDSTFLYDVSRELVQAEAFRQLLVTGEVPPEQATNILDEWLGSSYFSDC